MMYTAPVIHIQVSFGGRGEDRLTSLVSPIAE